MKSLTLSQVVSILALAFMASIIPACGGGGGGAAPAAAQGAPTGTGKIHVSSTLAGPVACAANASVLLRTVSFTPTDPNDVILYVLVEAQYTTVASASFGFYTLDIQDANGNSLGSIEDAVPNHLPGTNMPLRMYGQPFQTAGNAHFFSEGQFPSPSYTMKLYVTAGTTASISTSSIVIKIVTLEGVQTVNPSSLITG